MRINCLLVTFFAFFVATCSAQNPKVPTKENLKFSFVDQTTDTNYHFKIDRPERVVVLSYDVKNKPVCLNSDGAIYNDRLKFEKSTGEIVRKTPSNYSGLNSFMASEFGSRQLKVLVGKGDIILDVGNRKGEYSFYILDFVNCDELWNGKFNGIQFLIEVPE